MLEQTTSQSLVSVVIPYYQHKKYIDNCVNSIVDQTYEDIELIVIDDCSPDGSGEYVKTILKDKSLLERFSGQVNYIHFEQNQGAHTAINYGINQAQGEIIAVVNSDDLYHPERIKIMVKAMKKEQKEFAFSEIICIDDDGEDITEIDSQARDFALFQQKATYFPTLGFASLTGNPGISTGNFVFTKKLYQSTVGFRDLRYCHDWDFLLQCLCYTEPLLVNEKLYYYRFHETNTFKSLQEEGVHISDSAQVLMNYFDSVCCQKTVNPLAPSPFNWPGYFELFLTLYHYEEHYQKSVYVNT
jgi:glycosyltransferase involved in cell wall biosynthesis